MGNGSGVSRGDRNRNGRLERLRALVPVTNAIAGIDLAGSKQMVVVTDHDSKVIARRVSRCRAWDLGSARRRSPTAVLEHEAAGSGPGEMLAMATSAAPRGCRTTCRPTCCARGTDGNRGL